MHDYSVNKDEYEDQCIRSSSCDLRDCAYRRMSDVMASRGSYQKETSEEGRNGCTRCCDIVYPSGFWPELKSMIILAWPIILTQVCQMMLGPISLMFCGHLGDPIKLDGAALGISMVNVTAVSVAQGLGTACDTVFSQSFGGNNKENVGVYLQKAVYVFILVLLPCYALHLNLEDLLLVVGQNPEVSRLAGRYLLFFMPGAFFFFMYIILSKYIQNQNIVLPNVVIGMTANVVNGILHYLLLYRYTLGTDGSAVAMSCSYFVMFILTLFYIIVSKVYKTTWTGWTCQSLHDWGGFVGLAIPGMLMLCMEWWGFEIGVFVTGLLGTTELGAQAVLLQIDSVWFQIPLGLQIATAIRVGQHLGAGDATAAKTVTRLAITAIVVLTILPLSVYIGLQYRLPYVFTNIEEVANLTSSLMPIVMIYLFFDSIAGACKGVLFGTGRQNYGAILMFVSYYMLALPSGIPLMFLTSLRSAGYWWALAGNLILQSVVLSIIILRTNWAEIVKKARLRAGVIENNNGNIMIKSPALIDAEANETTALLSKPHANGHVGIDDKSEPVLTCAIVIRRCVALAVVLAIFLTGLSCRLFLPHQRDVATGLVDWNATQTHTESGVSNHTTILF